MSDTRVEPLLGSPFYSGRRALYFATVAIGENQPTSPSSRGLLPSGVLVHSDVKATQP